MSRLHSEQVWRGQGEAGVRESGPAPEDPKVNKFKGAGLELEGRESVPQVSKFEQVHS